LTISFLRHPRALPSFPTRRSSDLSRSHLRTTLRKCDPGPHDLKEMRFRRGGGGRGGGPSGVDVRGERGDLAEVAVVLGVVEAVADRKSTRLNSSHVSISYAVFCLK